MKLAMVALLLLLPAAAVAEEESKPKKLDISGCVQRGVEAGCTVLVTSGGKQYTLLGERLPAPGTFVQVRGEVRPDTVTFCMQGTAVHVTSVRTLARRCPREAPPAEK